MYDGRNIISKKTAMDDNYLSYKNKRKLVLRWLSLSKCLVIKTEDQEIMFVFKSILYMIHLKKHPTKKISHKLRHKINMYINYGIVAKAIYDVFELETILLNTEKEII